MNIYLIGYRCSGKTTVGKVIAERMQMIFFDTDEQIINRCNMKINDIVRKYGWYYFREKEKKILFELSLKNGCVIATGGGVILDSYNVYLMKKSGIVIWLKTNIEIIRKLILINNRTSELRPSLTGEKIEVDIEKTFNSRIMLYDVASDFHIDTNDFNLDYISDRILKFIICNS